VLTDTAEQCSALPAMQTVILQGNFDQFPGNSPVLRVSDVSNMVTVGIDAEQSCQ
jgi:hypothetical protein